MFLLKTINQLFVAACVTAAAGCIRSAVSGRGRRLPPGGGGRPLRPGSLHDGAEPRAACCPPAGEEARPGGCGGGGGGHVPGIEPPHILSLHTWGRHSRIGQPKCP